MSDTATMLGAEPWKSHLATLLDAEKVGVWVGLLECQVLAAKAPGVQQ